MSDPTIDLAELDAVCNNTQLDISRGRPVDGWYLASVALGIPEDVLRARLAAGQRAEEAKESDDYPPADQDSSTYTPDFYLGWALALAWIRGEES